MIFPTQLVVIIVLLVLDLFWNNRISIRHEIVPTCTVALKPQTTVFTLLFVYRLNKRNTSCW